MATLPTLPSPAPSPPLGTPPPQSATESQPAATSPTLPSPAPSPVDVPPPPQHATESQPMATLPTLPSPAPSPPLGAPPPQRATERQPVATLQSSSVTPLTFDAALVPSDTAFGGQPATEQPLAQDTADISGAGQPLATTTEPFLEAALQPWRPPHVAKAGVEPATMSSLSSLPSMAVVPPRLARDLVIGHPHFAI